MEALEVAEAKSPASMSDRAESAQLRIERAAGAGGTAADHTNVERFILDVLESVRAALHSGVVRVREDVQGLAVAPFVATGLAAFLP